MEFPTTHWLIRALDLQIVGDLWNPGKAMKSDYVYPPLERLLQNSSRNTARKTGAQPWKASTHFFMNLTVFLRLPLHGTRQKSRESQAQQPSRLNTLRSNGLVLADLNRGP